MFQGTGAKSGYVVAADLDRSLEPIAAMQRTILLIGGSVLVLGLLMTLAVASGIVRPLRRLVDGTHRVIEGDYTFQVENPAKDEVGELSSAFQKMVEGLRERENIRSLFGKYVHPSIVSGLLEDPENVFVGGQRQVQTLLFGDVENFVGLSSGMNAEALVEFLNSYLGAMTEELTRSEGILDKYLGDGLMAFFGPPFTPGNHALAGCVAALRMQSRLKELAAGWQAEGLPPIRTRIGLSTGEVVVGNIGSEHMRDYTCIGEAVNMASRLENLNRHYGTAIITDAATREMAGRSVMVRELDTVRVVGSDLDSHLYELISLTGEQDADTAELIERYGVALGDYRAGRFGRAGRHFEALIKPPFNDAPSRVMAARCLELKQNPRQGWDGVHEMLEK
jgi:adenylate cyclase